MNSLNERAETKRGEKPRRKQQPRASCSERQERCRGTHCGKSVCGESWRTALNVPTRRGRGEPSTSTVPAKYGNGDLQARGGENRQGQESGLYTPCLGPRSGPRMREEEEEEEEEEEVDV